MGGLCLSVELHREGSAMNRASLVFGRLPPILGWKVSSLSQCHGNHMSNFPVIQGTISSGGAYLAEQGHIGHWPVMCPAASPRAPSIQWPPSLASPYHTIAYLAEQGHSGQWCVLLPVPEHHLATLPGHQEPGLASLHQGHHCPPLLLGVAGHLPDAGPQQPGNEVSIDTVPWIYRFFFLDPPWILKYKIPC